MTVFIPAKGVSARIHRKNLVLIDGHPLIDWSLRVCHFCPDIGEVFVATEDAEIEARAKFYGASNYPLTVDDIEDRRTVSSLWKAFCENRSGPQLILQPTTPLRRMRELRRAIEMYETGEHDVVFSVRQEKKRFMDANGNPILDPESQMLKLSQNLESCFFLTGSFCLADAAYVRSCQYFEEGRVGMVVAGRGCIDVDEPEDLELVRAIAKGSDWWNTLLVKA